MNLYDQICRTPQGRKKLLIYGGAAMIVIAIIIAIAVVATASFEGEFKGRMALSDVPLIDGHNDLPYKLYNVEKNQIENFNFNSDLLKDSKWGDKLPHTDLPRLREGLVGGQFWVAYVSCETSYKDAVEKTMAQIDVTKRFIAKYPNDLAYVTTAAGIEQAFKDKKIASLLCVEGGHSIDSQSSILRLYYELGVRYLTLTHSCQTPWSDNNELDRSTTAYKVGGLSDWGKNLVREMNRLGMMVDLSHVAKPTMEVALEVSVAPVIFSHSSAYAIKEHTRNVQDDVLLKLKTNGGIIMVNFYNNFIGDQNATIDDAIKHLNHIKDLIGPDHIGIGADYDGVELTPQGLEDVSKYPDLFDRLAEPDHGYTPWTRDELKKLAGLNLIRVFKEVERVRDELKDQKIFETNISEADLDAIGADKTCRT